MISIIICDDHKMFRAGLKELLNDFPGIKVTDEAEDGEILLKKLRTAECDMVILDISLPGSSGLEVLKQLKLNNPSIPVMILSTYPEDQYAIRMFKAGAAGYLHKDSEPEELVLAIRSIAQNKKYISPKMANILIEHLNDTMEESLHEKLSDREYEIMLMITHGLGIPEMAEKLHISPKTVSTYKARIMEKMNFDSTAELVKYVVENNLSA